MSALLSTFDDDTTVNAMASTLLLDFADIAQAPEVECHRKDVQLKAQFKNASYRAFSDGVLWTQSHAVQGLLEVNKKRRGTDIKTIQMQETAEMVAWFKQKPEEHGIFKCQ